MYTYLIGKGQTAAWDIVFNNESNWKKAEYPEIPNFIYGSMTVGGDVKPFDGSKLGYFHKKVTFFEIMSRHRVSCAPRTYTSYTDFINSRQYDNKLWFHKLSAYDCGSGVTPFFNNRNDIQKIKKLSNKRCNCGTCEKNNKYIIQEGIKNIMLYNGKKFDLRVHVLITPEKKIYIYHNVLMRISNKKYSNCSCVDHQCTNGSLGKMEAKYTESWTEWEKLYPQVEMSTKEIMKAMKNHMQKGRYLLLGIDYIFDISGKAWVLEANTYPCLYYDPKDGIQHHVTHMLQGMLNILVHNKDGEYWKYLMTI